MLAVYVVQVFPDLPELSTLLLIVMFIAHFCMVLSGSVEMFNLFFFFLLIMGETVSNNLLVVLMFRWIIYPNKMVLVFKFVAKTTTRYGLLFRAPVFCCSCQIVYFSCSFETQFSKALSSLNSPNLSQRKLRGSEISHSVSSLPKYCISPNILAIARL